MTIACNTVSVVYDTIPALHDVTFTLEDGGGMVLLTGPTGAGKTTLLRLLHADVFPTAGTVTIDGVPTTSMSPSDVRRLRRTVGIVEQRCRLIRDYTVYDNVILPLAARGMAQKEANRRCLAVLADLQVSYVRHKLPHQLSGGERHLVALARALVVSPSVLIADEPTGTLDETTSSLVATMLQRQVDAGMQVIVSTHAASLVAAFPTATRLTVDDGRVRHTPPIVAE